MAARVTRRRSRAPVGDPGARVSEAVEQLHIVQFLRTLGSDVFVLGTHRPRGQKCRTCGTFVAEHQGTCQTPGLADVQAFLPPRDGRRRLLMVEVKAKDGRLRPEQAVYRDCCLSADVAHVVGGLDAVIAWTMEHGYVKREQVPHYRLPAPCVASQTQED